jgi:hypothetical protein
MNALFCLAVNDIIRRDVTDTVCHHENMANTVKGEVDGRWIMNLGRQMTRSVLNIHLAIASAIQNECCKKLCFVGKM